MVESFIWLTICVYFEGRGESTSGQVAIAQVILTRAQERGLSVIEVIHQPEQFSWLNDGVPDAITDFPAFVACAKSVALAWLDRLNGETLSGANHYYNPNKVDPPAWSLNMKKIALIGNHLFLKG